MEDLLYDIPAFPGYKITRTGKIWSEPRRGRAKGLFLATPLDKTKGYFRVCLYRDRRKNMKRVHQLMLETFVGPRPKGKGACHRNDIKTDNRLENLYWGTRSENWGDAAKNGKRSVGEDSPWAKLNNQQVRVIRRLLPYPKEFTQKEIGELFGVSRGAIREIKHGRNWKFV